MFRISLVLLISMCFGGSAFGDPLLLAGIAPFGFDMEKLSHCTPDSIVYSKADSLRKVLTGDSFARFPYAKYCVNLPDVPCISYYPLRVDEFPETSRNLNRNVLYNSCNGGIYLFGGEMSSFNSVFGGYLRDNFNRDFILQLLSFYINTLEESGLYLVLGEERDVNLLIAGKRSASYRNVLLYAIAAMKKYRPDLIHPVAFSRMGDSYQVEFNTWGPEGQIEYWHFHIYPDSISLQERENIGYFDLYDYEPVDNIFEWLEIDEDSLWREFEKGWDFPDTVDEDSVLITQPDSQKNE